MLGGFGGATKDKHINGRLTSLCLIGGVDCLPGYTPDLKVQGGARIKKTLCVLGAANFTDIDVSGNSVIHENLVVEGNAVLSNIVVDKIEANILTTNSAVISSDILVCGNTILKGELTILGNVEFDCGILDNINVLNVATINSSCGANSISIISDTELYGDISITNDMLVCGDTRIKGNLLVEGAFTLSNIIFETIVANDIYANIIGTNNLIAGNIDLQCGSLDNVEELNVHTINSSCGFTDINIKANVDMNCNIISNVMAMHVGNLYGKSPIQVNDNLHMKDTISGGKITYESGVEIGNSTTFVLDMNGIAIGKGSVVLGNNAVAIGVGVSTISDNYIQLGQSINSGTNAKLKFRSQQVSSENWIGGGLTSAAIDNNGDIIRGNIGGGGWVGTATSNLNMACYTIANVMAMYVGNLYGKSPIQVHDNFNMKKDVIGKGKITWDAGIEIGSDLTIAGNLNSISIGKGAISNLNNAIAIGTQSNSTQYSIAVGYQSLAITTNNNNLFSYSNNSGPEETCISIGPGSLSHYKGISMGNGAKGGSNSVTIGTSAISYNTRCITIGDETYNNGFRSVSIGATSICQGSDGVSLGYKASSKMNSVAIGSYSATQSGNSVALGYRSFCTTDRGIAIGRSSLNRSARSVVIGSSARSDILTTGSTIIGYNAYTRGNDVVSVGDRSYCYSSDSLSLGSNARVYTFSNNSVAIGANSFLNNSSNSIAIGSNSAINYCTGSISVGTNSQSLSSFTVAIGYNTSVSTIGSVEIQNTNYSTPTSTAKVWGQIFQDRSWSGGGLTGASIDNNGNIVRSSSVPEFMYMCDTLNSNLYTLNLTQGTSTATLVGSTITALTDMCFDIYGNCWGINSNNLYSINIYTGAATLRGALGGSLSGGARGLSSSPSGVLYCMGFNDTNLYSVDTNTGAATPLFATGYLCQGALRWYNGYLYVTAQGASPMNLIQIDVVAMTATLLTGSLPNSSTYGLAVSRNNTFYGIAGSVYFQITVSGVTVSNSAPITLLGTAGGITGASFVTE